MKNLKRNVVRCFNVLKMNVCDTVPRSILHFFVTQLVDDLDRALEKENLVHFLQERKDIRDKREMCRKQSQALEKALPRTTDVLDKLLHMRQGSPVKSGKIYWTGTFFSFVVFKESTRLFNLYPLAWHSFKLICSILGGWGGITNLIVNAVWGVPGCGRIIV